MFSISNSDICEFPKLNFILSEIDLSEEVSQIKWVNILIAVFPATIVIFSENITKITLVEKMLRSDKKSIKNVIPTFYQMATFGHSISFMLSIFLGSVPTAIYAENIALMEINNIEGSNKNKIYEENDSNIDKYYNKLSTYPLKIAALIAIICSFFTIFRDILTSIPMAVYGGMELFVFAIISAQGVQLLVDRKVNYKKITNQIITSMTLLTGLSGISIKLGVTEIKGLSLALLVGVGLNLFFKICSYFGLINEKINVIEILELFNSFLKDKSNSIIKADGISPDEFQQFLKGENRTDRVINLVAELTKVEITTDDSKHLQISEGNDGIIVIKVLPYIDTYIKIVNDYPENVVKIDGSNSLSIIVNNNLSVYKLKKIFYNILN